MSAGATTQKCRIRLAPGRHVHAENPRDCHVLVYPAGVVQLNECAAAILALCDGTRTREEIIEHILPSTREADLAVGVRAFLGVARKRGWIIES